MVTQQIKNLATLHENHTFNNAIMTPPLDLSSFITHCVCYLCCLHVGLCSLQMSPFSVSCFSGRQTLSGFIASKDNSEKNKRRRKLQADSDGKPM